MAQTTRLVAYAFPYLRINTEPQNRSRNIIQYTATGKLWQKRMRADAANGAQEMRGSGLAGGSDDGCPPADAAAANRVVSATKTIWANKKQSFLRASSERIPRLLPLSPPFRPRVLGQPAMRPVSSYATKRRSLFLPPVRGAPGVPPSERHISERSLLFSPLSSIRVPICGPIYRFFCFWANARPL